MPWRDEACCKRSYELGLAAFTRVRPLGDRYRQATFRRPRRMARPADRAHSWPAALRKSHTDPGRIQNGRPRSSSNSTTGCTAAWQCPGHDIGAACGCHHPAAALLTEVVGTALPVGALVTSSVWMLLADPLVKSQGFLAAGMHRWR